MATIYEGWTAQPTLSPRRLTERDIEHLSRLCSGTLEQINTNRRIGWYKLHPALLLRDELYLAECRSDLEAALHDLETIVAQQ